MRKVDHIQCGPMLCPVEAKRRCIVEISSSVVSRPITMAFTTRGYQVIRYDQEEFKSDPCPAMLAAEIYNQMEMPKFGRVDYPRYFAWRVDETDLE